VPILLPAPQLLEISGPDAAAFAHAQFSSDVGAMADGQWQWSAWLSAQGRVRAFFRLLRSSGERTTLILNGGSADALQASLRPYMLRSKVQLRSVEGRRALGFFDSGELQEKTGSVPRGDEFIETQSHVVLAAAGHEPRWLLVEDAIAATPTVETAQALNSWRAADITAGIVELDDALRDRYLPAWMNLERLGAVSVRKGCYPGQEIVARLYFKGGNKRWLHRVEFSAAELPPPGTALGTDAESGELLNAAWTAAPHGLGLAVLPDASVGKSLTAAAMPGVVFRVVSAVDRAGD
jgi:tRNA-modifying protein YgfZ